MTAFARRSLEGEWGRLTWEIRTVNHRYLETDLRLPEALREVEGTLREWLSSRLRRGKVECYLKYRPGSQAMNITVNEALMSQLSTVTEKIKTMWGLPLSTSLTDLMNWPGLLEVSEHDKNLVHEAIITLFKESLESIVNMRQREGEAISQRIESRLVEVLEQADKVKKRLPQVMEQQRQKIQMRMKELDLAIEPKRLEEELLLLIQKMDVSEEIERLEIHVQEVRQTLNSETKAVGRRLDFLMQELHREANTLGSKSADAEVTHAAIHLKVLIEQMREQVQNVE